MPDSSSGFTPVIDFRYVVNALHWRIEQGQELAAHLGYPSAEALPPFTEELLHPEDRGKIARLVRRIGDFALQLGPDATLRSTFILAHRMKRADGSYAKILRYLQPDAMGSAGRLERYQCFCTDVSRLPGFESVSFDVRLPADVVVSTEEALRFFADVLDDALLHFTERELQVLRVWALTNTARHAAASKVSVALVRNESMVVVDIADNGQGFDVAEVLARGGQPHGMGLLGMRERVTLLGGRFDIEAQPGAGTRLLFSIPWEQP